MLNSVRVLDHQTVTEKPILKSVFIPSGLKELTRQINFFKRNVFLSRLVLLNRIPFAVTIVESSCFFLIMMIGTEHR